MYGSVSYGTQPWAGWEMDSFSSLCKIGGIKKQDECVFFR